MFQMLQQAVAVALPPFAHQWNEIAIVIMFGLTDDPTMRKQLIGYLDRIVPFIVGAATGGAVGGSIGFARGMRKKGIT